jgi:hypothetical protein
MDNSVVGMASKLLWIEKGIIQLRPLHSEGIYQHPGLRLITDFCMMTSSEDLSNKHHLVKVFKC